MNKGLELQKIVVNSAKNIKYLKENNITVFASVPAKVNIPYIKISNISMNKTQDTSGIQNFTIDLFVATNGKNNCQILEIMENLYNDLYSEINTYIASIGTDIQIFNVYNANYSIEEDLKNNIWSGNFYIDIDVI